MVKQSALLFATLLLAGPVVRAQQPTQPQRPAALQSIDDRTSGMKKIDGYFPLYWDERTGGLFVEISRFDSDFLFSTGLSAGLGLGLFIAQRIAIVHGGNLESLPSWSGTQLRISLQAVH